MAVIKVDENDPVGELEPSFPFRDVKILHNVDVRDYYDLKEEIGRGKFGTVYRCVEKKTGTVLAAKFVPIAKKQDRINVEREVEIMRTLQHPRLIQLYDSFEIKNVMCVVLELIEGGELFERVIDDDFILTEKACSCFMRQICEGVGFIHQNKVIHLDLKPENILCLTKTGNRIKIIDFGLARKYDPSKKLQVLFGTPEFVAPEVVNFDEITSATDMWSVGVICYVLLSGLSPFMGESDLETMTNVTLAQYDLDDEAFDTISADAKDFISKLLVKNKEKRLTSEECLGHPWLKKKPPPPMFLEQCKENLKTFVDSNRSSSPFLLNDSLTNGPVNQVHLITVSEIPKPKAGFLEKSVELFETVPEVPNTNKQEMNVSNETKLKLKNEMNLEKSGHPSIVIETENSLDENCEPPIPEKVFLQNKNKETTPRKLMKTDSFKELPRKFSITILEDMRGLPRRSSLTRADKAKNEIKRENFVTFIGPREIKPIDPEVKKAVEELTNFIKLNIEESTSSKTKNESVDSASTSKTLHINPDENLKKTEETDLKKNATSHKISKIDISKEDLSKVTCRKQSQKSEIKKVEEKIVSSKKHTILPNTSTSVAQISEERVNIPSFLRPADYIKSSNLLKESLQASNKSLENRALESISGMEKSVAGLLKKKTTLDNPTVLASSLLNEISNSKFSKVSIAVETKEKLNSSSNQHFVETLQKLKSGKVDFFKSSSTEHETNPAKLKSSDPVSVKPWLPPSIRTELTLPRKFIHGIENYKTESSSENPSSSSTTRESNKTRASSLDPISTGLSTIGIHDRPIQSRFLRNSQPNTHRCSSEVPVSKYEEFRNRYFNYKELASDNDMILKKGFTERTPEKKEQLVESPAPVYRSNSTENNLRSSVSTKISNVSQSSSSSVNISTRQKFKVTEQQRDSYNKFDSLRRSSKDESVTSSFRSHKDRYNSSFSGCKDNLSVKQPQNSQFKSKSAVPEKDPSSPSKKV